MNKLITKIVGAALGLTMTVGVGVAIGVSNSNKRIEPARASGTDVTYTVASTSSVTTTGTAPIGSTATFSSTGGDSGRQLTYGKALTLTLSGFDGSKIIGLSLEMKSNTSKGKGSMSFKSGSNVICEVSDNNFSNSSWNGAWSTSYVSISWPSTNHNLTETTVGTSENVVLNITNHGSSNSTNSLYLNSVVVTYEPASSSDSVTAITSISGTPTAKTHGSWDLSGLTVSGTLNSVTDSDITSYVDLSTNTPVPTTAGSASVSVTASLKDGVSGGASDLTDSLTGTVVEGPVIETNLKSMSWGTSSYADAPHTLTFNSSYEWIVSAGQSGNNGCLGSNETTKITVANNDSWTLKGTTIAAAIEDAGETWSTYAAAFYMSNFGVLHPTKFIVKPATVGAIGSTRNWYILSSADSGDSWSILESGSDIQAGVEMSWEDASEYSSSSNLISFAFLMSYSAVKTISDISIDIYGDSYSTTKVLSSIYLSGTPTKTYYAGQHFSLGSAKVYARYTDSTTYPDADISSDPALTWTSIEYGTTSVTGTYNGKTVEVTGITVNAEGTVYKKIANTSELIEGSRIIFGKSDGTYTMCKQSSNNRIGELAGGEYGYYEDGDIENYSVNTTVFVVGITENGYTFFDESENGYLYASSSSNNYLRTRASVGSDLCAEWNVTISDGVATIVDAGENSHNTINYTTSSGNHVFGAYENPTSVVSIYTNVESTLLEGFGETYLYMSTYDQGGSHGSTGGDGSCSSYYLPAKTALIAMGSVYIDELQNNSALNALQARYEDWAVAVGDSTPYSGTGIVPAQNANNAAFNISSSSGLTSIIVIISVLGLTTLGGYFILRKRKEQ